MTDEKKPPEEALRLFRCFGEAVEETIRQHEARCPFRMADNRPPPHLGAIPFADWSIPDESLARMVEILSTDPLCDVEALSQRFNYPAPLIERELALYMARYRRWIEAQEETA